MAETNAVLRVAASEVQQEKATARRETLAGVAIITGAGALIIGGIFLAVYANSSVANALKLAQMNGSLAGRIVFIGTLSGGFLIVGAGTTSLLICRSSKKSKLEQVNHSYPGNTPVFSLAGPTAAVHTTNIYAFEPKKERKEEEKEKPVEISSDSTPYPTPTQTPTPTPVTSSTNVSSPPDTSGSAPIVKAASTDSQPDPEAEVEGSPPPSEDDKRDPVDASVPLPQPTENAPIIDSGISPTASPRPEPPALKPSRSDPLIATENDSEPKAGVAPSALAVLQVHSAAPEIVLNDSLFVKYKTEKEKQALGKDVDVEWIDRVEAAVQMQVEKALADAILFHQRLVDEMGSSKVTLDGDGYIVVDPKTYIMALELASPLMNSIQYWLSQDDKIFIVQTLLLGQRLANGSVKPRPFKLIATTPFTETISLEEKKHMSLTNFFSPQSFGDSLENAVEQFVKGLEESSFDIQFDPDAYLASVASQPEKVSAMLANDEFYKKLQQYLEGKNPGRKLECIFQSAKAKHGGNPKVLIEIQKFGDAFGKATRIPEKMKPETAQALLDFKLIELIYMLGSLDIKTHLRKGLEKNHIIASESDTLAPVSKKLDVKIQGSVVQFNSDWTGLRVNTYYEIEGKEGVKSGVQLNAEFAIPSPNNLSQCVLNLISNNAFDLNLSKELVLSLGRCLNKSMEEASKAEIKKRAKDLALKIRAIHGEKAKSDLKNHLRDLLTSIQGLIVQFNIYGAIVTAPFDRKDKDLIELLSAIEDSVQEFEILNKNATDDDIIQQIAYYYEFIDKALGGQVCEAVDYVSKIEQHTDDENVLRVKSEKYQLSLGEMEKALKKVLSTDQTLQLKSLDNLSRLKACAEDELKKLQGVNTGYLAPLWNWWNGKSASEENPQLVLFQSLKTICDALSFDRKAKADSFTNTNFLNNLRMQYLQNFMPALTNGIGLFEEKKLPKDFDHFKPIFYHLADHLYANINLDEHFFGLIETFGKGSPPRSPIGGNRKHEQNHIIEALKSTYRAFERLSSSQTAPFHHRMWKSFINNNHRLYPNHEGNPTHHLHSIRFRPTGASEWRPILIKAYGSPTVENGKGTAKICNEFIAHLSRMEERGESHMHVSYQDMRPCGTFLGTGIYLAHSDETDRSNVIVELQDSKRFKDTTFYGIVLSKDSDFYHQKNRKTGPASFYKIELMDQFFALERHVSGCYLPEKIKNHPTLNAEKLCRDLIDAIHEELFPGKNDLTVAEKKRFTETFYTLLPLKLAIELRITSLSGVCKDMIDRGMMAIVRLFGFCGIAAGTKANYDEHFIKRMKGYVMARAYEVRKRVPIKERFDRMIEDYDFALNNAEAVKKLFKRVFPGLEFNV